MRWLDDPEEKDYPAAADFLSLVLDPDDVARAVDALRAAPTTSRKAKDLARASRLPLLAVDNPHVAKDLRKIRDGVPLSPILLVRGDARVDRPLVVADGYHRICASYLTDEDVEVPCRIVDL